MEEYELLFKEYMKLKDAYEKLQDENRELREKLDPLEEAPSIDLTREMENNASETQELDSITLHSTPDLKIDLFRSLFRGREDVYALRWESISNGKSGYIPACAYEWKKGVCFKPKMKCGDCNQRKYLHLTDKDIYEHLSSKNSKTIGIYPLLRDETCYFLAVDFDKDSWQDDAKAFLKSCKEFGVPAALECSRSGNGAHIWIFFETSIRAGIARRLGSLILTYTLERRHQLGMDSYDRFFPNQDTLPKGGFGNLIALPLQGIPRAEGKSIFLDENLSPYKDQWHYLSTIKRLRLSEVEEVILRLEEQTSELLGAPQTNIDAEDEAENLWSNNKQINLERFKINETLPTEVKVIVGNMLYIDKQGLPPRLMNYLIRTAVFNNPEFYRAQAMRLPIYNKPRIIDCSEEHLKYLVLPRGCIESAKQILEVNEINLKIQEERNEGIPIDATFTGVLTGEQKRAAETLFIEEQGVLSAATGFGKTVIASWIIGERKVNTLIIVHRRQLLDQWKERISTFLDVDRKNIGEIGGGKNKRTGIIDIAIMQSLISRDQVKKLVEEYGQVIVDECHHVSAFSFEQIMKTIKAKYVYGLTATPTRKDGHQPIVLMQCGPIRYKVDTKQMVSANNMKHVVIPRNTNFQYQLSIDSKKPSIQESYGAMISDEERNDMIFNDVLMVIEKGYTPLLLTERTAHVDYFEERFKGFVKNIIVFRGGMGKRQRQALEEQINSIQDNEERLIISTGRYIGEGFDDARLDCLFLTMPISWKGTLQQYAGRLHRHHANKRKVQIFDYVDNKVPMLFRMYKKRLSGYKIWDMK
ncbi:TOTE conflict system archaeo-eukaryotic primase domain-containing protein [Anaerosolibacter sp.]|uniref:TOTE conflict system archaeo-eukaryotic primase domain-containing protein n=1 Tax=Anaerosolibacter sp. TaxID=1872527 RepID=UPI0039EF39BE